MLLDPFDGGAEEGNSLIVFLEETETRGFGERGGDDLERGDGKGVGVEVGPGGEFSGMVDELFGMGEEGRELVIEIGELEVLGQFELFREGGVREEFEEEGDEGGVGGELFGGFESVFDFGERNRCEAGEDGGEEVEVVELDEHGAEFAEDAPFF